ncbi:Mut7-C RNAse domain-containing protein [Rhodococcus gannanensis]|uniref:Mut7-C RNAse domain-containing protein n=1 Tax=Rhodococcus gannanensis TaxID=1960308 RepID=A0ABW4P830_9NOCA
MGIVQAPGCCEFRFYEELNDFLPPDRRRRTFRHTVDGTPSVKDRIESLGVPHTEVDLILVDGEPVGFDRLLRGGERVAVYPVFERFDLTGVSPLRPRPLRVPRFVADVHLGRLASLLRLLGFDCRYDNSSTDEALAAVSAAEARTVLTRDVGLLRRSAVTRGAFVHATDPRLQLREILDRFDLRGRVEPFTRCARCNGALTPVDRAAVTVPDAVAARHTRFTRCDGCGQVYWPGSHVERLRRRLAEVGITM